MRRPHTNFLAHMQALPSSLRSSSQEFVQFPSGPEKPQEFTAVKDNAQIQAFSPTGRRVPKHFRNIILPSFPAKRIWNMLSIPTKVRVRDASPHAHTISSNPVGHRNIFKTLAFSQALDNYLRTHQFDQAHPKGTLQHSLRH